MSKTKPDVEVSSVNDEMSVMIDAFRSEPLFQDDPAAADPRVGIAAWLALKALDNAIQGRMEEYRAHYMDYAEKNGTETDNGGNRVFIDNCEVLKEKRPSKLPDEDKLKAYLQSKNIKLSECFDEVARYELNPSKLEHMIETGRIDQEGKKQIEEMKKVSYAFKVKPSSAISKTIQRMINKMLGKPHDTKLFSPKK